MDEQVREYATPEVVADPDPELNMAHTVVRHALEHPEAVLFSLRSDDGWAPVTAAQFAHAVEGVARGLIAAGLEPGDRVALMSATRYEWTLLDYAIWTAGCITVPVYESSSSDQLRWILADSGARALVLETAEHASRFAEVTSEVNPVPRCWQLDAGGLDSLVDEGRGITQSVLDDRRNSARSADLATLVYTSGTTGQPKGCALSHRTLWGTAQTAAALLPELFDENGSTLIFLPLAHIFGRLIQCACVQSRVRVGYTSDVTNLVADLASFSPTFLLAVPRVFEKVYGSYRHAAHSSGRGALFDRAERTAIAYSQALDEGGPGPLLRLRHRVFDKLLYGPKLRAPLGGALTYSVSGGAPLGPRLGHFFRGIGVTVLEGYGLTETTAACAVNTPRHMRVGTVGRPSPGCAVKIAADNDEILLRGRPVFDGYWGDGRATAEVRSADGWFRTGDIGQLDPDGYLTITGRIKEILVTAAGKNVAPAPLEDRIRSNALVSHAMVVGDKKRFIAALITLDEEAVGRWAQAHGTQAASGAAGHSDDPGLRREIQKTVDEANAAVSRAESVREFRILPTDFAEADGTLTPSLKIRRSVVEAKYRTVLEEIYRE